EPELVLASVPLVDVEVVVIAKDADHIFSVDRAAEELDRVIRGAEDLHKLDLGPAADGAERQTIDLFIGQDDGAWVTDRDVAEDAGIVVVVITAETIDLLTANVGIRQTFED